MVFRLQRHFLKHLSQSNKIFPQRLSSFHHLHTIKSLSLRPLCLHGPLKVLPKLHDMLIPRAFCEQLQQQPRPSQPVAPLWNKQTTTFNHQLDTENGQVSSWNYLLAFWKSLKDDWLLLISVSITSIAAAMVNVHTPRVIGSIANILSSALMSGTAVSSVFLQIRQPALLLCSLFACQGLLTFIYIALVTALGESVASRLRKKLYKRLLEQDIAFFDTTRAGELVSALSNDISDFKHSFKICVSQGLKSATQIVGYVIQLFQISSSITGYLFTSSPILYGLGSLYGAYLRHLSKQAKDAEGSFSALASEAFTNIRTVRAFANEEYEMERFSGSVELASQKQNKLGYHIGIFQGFTNFAIGGMIVFVLYLGGNQVADGQMSGGDLMSYLISIQNAQKSLASITVLFAQTVKSATAFNRVCDYLMLEPAIPISGGTIPHALDGRISFQNVKFAYPSRLDHVVFDSFNLTIPAGSVYALCGSSGAGKSTIGALIERFYDPIAGDITIDGQNIREIDPKWLRNNIGFIHQEPILFAGTILDNIKYAKPYASMDEVLEAARSANAADFIDGLPDKYDTVVGERGVTLSGGQRQRIAIARALLKNPKILIFDEATSALDANSERIVQEALGRLMKGRTVIVIAHRLSTIQSADQIVLLGRGGKIMEMGSHAELMNLRGGYYQLYSSMNNK